MTRLADELMVREADWRCDAGTVGNAYRRWAAGGADEAALFASYLAALDQEECAAASCELLNRALVLLMSHQAIGGPL